MSRNTNISLVVRATCIHEYIYKIHICSSEYDALPIYFHQFQSPHIDALYTSYVNDYNALSPSEHAQPTRRAEIMLDYSLVEYVFCHLLQRSRC